MRNIEPSNNKVLIDTRPMFASTWMALFTELRKNYNERHLIDPIDVDRTHLKQQERSGLK